jgi:hypothetical protein
MRCISFDSKWGDSGIVRCRGAVRTVASCGTACGASSPAGCPSLPSVILIPCAAWASLPEARAGCGKSACPHLWRGSRAIVIPTPTFGGFLPPSPMARGGKSRNREHARGGVASSRSGWHGECRSVFRGASRASEGRRREKGPGAGTPSRSVQGKEQAKFHTAPHLHTVDIDVAFFGF